MLFVFVINKLGDLPYNKQKLLHNSNIMDRVYRFRIEKDKKKIVTITRMQSVKEDVWHNFERERTRE